MQLISRIIIPDVNGFIEILSLAIIFYYIILFFRGTRAAPTLTGFIFVFIVLIIATHLFRLDALNWILQRFSVYLAVALLVIFQPEIRRALAEVGKQNLFGSSLNEKTLIDQIQQTVSMLSKRKIGALIAIEQDIGTRAIQETGVKINSKLTPELLASIFFPYTPLHDGGVIISQDQIVAARCLFPLSRRRELSKTLGTRHRAAVGLTEETDAIAVVVSEETGNVSLSHNGRIFQNLNEEQLRRFLQEILITTKGKEGIFVKLKKQVRFFLKSKLRKKKFASQIETSP